LFFEIFYRRQGISDVYTGTLYLYTLLSNSLVVFWKDEECVGWPRYASLEVTAVCRSQEPPLDESSRYYYKAQAFDVRNG